MSSLDWETLRNANFDSFTDVAAAWNAYISNADLETALVKDISVLNDEGGDHERDDFDGETAEAIRAQAKRIVDLWYEDIEGPGRIVSICEDAAGAFTEKQTALETLIGDAGVYLFPTGGVGDERFEVEESALYNYLSGSSTITINTVDTDAFERQVREDAVTFTEQFKDFMVGARELDDEYDARFRALNDDPPPLPPFVGSPDYLEKAAVYDGERVAELLSGGEDGTVDDEELNTINSLLDYWAGNATFSTELLDESGPDGLLQSLTEIQASGHDGALAPSAVEALHAGLGQALATATDPDSQPHLGDAWAEEFMTLGAEPFHYDGKEGVGYQVYGPLLATGEYDTGFLVPVADHMLALNDSNQWPPTTEETMPWAGELGANPIDYALTALDHSPEAAADFFSPPPRDLAVDGPPPVEDPLTYLMEHAYTPGGSGPDTTGDWNINGDLLGNALESATTGYPSDTDPSEITDAPRHTNHQAELTQRVMEYALDHENEFVSSDGHLNAVMDNLGNISAHYMSDLHQAMSGTENGGDWLSESNGIGLGIAAGGDENQAFAHDWFKLLGHDPEAMATAWAASEGTMYGEIDTAARGDSPVTDSTEAVQLHADITGYLIMGGLDGIADGVDAWADAETAQVDLTAKGANFGVAVATSGLPTIPGLITTTAAGDAIGAIANAAKSDIATEAFSDTLDLQREYYEQAKGAIPTEAMDANIQTILESADPPLSKAETEAVPGFFESGYDKLVDAYLSGQIDENERHRN